MHTAWRRFAVVGALFAVLAGVDVIRAFQSRDLGAGAVALFLVGVVLMTVLAVLFLRQAVLRRRARRSTPS